MRSDQRRFASASLLLFFLVAFSAALLSRVSYACEAVRVIWAIENKSADPLFRFMQDGKAGYIDSKGRTVIRPSLTVEDNLGGEFHEGLLAVKDGEGYKYLGRSGKTVFHVDSTVGADFSEGLAPASQGGLFHAKFGFIDHSGRFVIPPQFYYVGSFSEGLAAASTGPGATGYIDHQGNWVIPPRLAEASSFHEGLAAVILEGPCRITNGGSCARAEYAPTGSQATYDCRFAFIDQSGKPISDLRFDDAKEFSEGLAAVRIGPKWGFAGKTGRMSIAADFESAEPFSEGLAAVRQDGRTGYIDASGRFVINPQFDYADSFSDGRAIVSEIDRNRGMLYRFIDKTGRAAFPGRFVQGARFIHGLAPVAYEMKGYDSRGLIKGRYAWIDTSGKAVLTYDLR